MLRFGIEKGFAGGKRAQRLESAHVPAQVRG
jgi:hypothetical protein